MSLPRVDDARVALALKLVDAAGAVVRPYFRSSFDIEAKGDQSPVTAADRAAEQVIRDMVARAFPDDGVIGEEFGAERGGASHVWVFDPIDGTRAFIAGRPLFGTLVALLIDGRPVLGIIDQPIIGDRWVGRAGEVTTFKGQPCRTRACPTLAAAHVGTTGPQHLSPDEWVRFQKLAAASRDTLYGGDCHNYGLLASGHLDLVVEAGLKLHDYAALIPVVEGAGGRMTDWHGQPLSADSDGSVIAAGNPALIAPTIAVLSA